MHFIYPTNHFITICFVKLPFSVGDAREIEVRDDDSFTLDDTESKES